MTLSNGTLPFFPKSQQSSNPNPNSPLYIHLAVALEALDKPTCPHLTDIWTLISDELQEDSDLLLCIRRIREALLKSSVLVGFPRAINALSRFHTSIKQSHPHLAALLEKDTSKRATLSKEQRNIRGQDFFNRVYTTKAETVEQNMSLVSGGDLSYFAISSVYGELMADESLLDAKETTLIEFLACYATGAAPQTNGHMYGARNLGNSKEEILGVVKVVKDVAVKLGLEIDFSEVDMVVQKTEKWD